MRVALCLYGYYNNRSDRNAGDKGYQYLKEKVFSKVEGVDVFIHSWDENLKEKIDGLYNPKIALYEKQRDFTPIARDAGIDEDWINENYGRKGTIYEQCTIQASLSFYYSRSRAIELKADYERTNKFKYDCVIVARFDIGHRSTWHMGYNVSLMPFNPTLDMNYIYSAMWKQLNAGYADQWFFSNSENIDKFGTMYENALNDYFQKNSDYHNAIINGWFDSNESNETSNEIINKDGLAIYYKYPRWQMINNHILHKWHLREAGLYEKSKFLGEMR